MSGKKRRRRGRPRQGRPQNAVQQTPAVPILSGSSQGAKPACKSTASKGQSPPEDAQEKEQSDGDNVRPAGSYVNGEAEADNATAGPGSGGGGGGAGGGNTGGPGDNAGGYGGGGGAGSDSNDAFPYSDGDEGIVWHKSADHHVRVTNFRARIIGDIARDDGIEVTRHYEIAATLGGKHYRFEVGANQFRNLAWVGEQLGAGAIVEPGQGMEARARHAMQVLSRDGITEKHIYAHTGWREIDGQHYFLHADGALGADGHRPDIDVDLPEQLSRYKLIEPESEEALRHAVRGAMLAMALAPPRVMAPVLGAVYRAPIGSSDITVGLYGKTGLGKTEVASVCQQHFGPGMDARHLPLAWESTANTIEDVLSAGKDVLTVVDEYVPGENSGDRIKLQAKAERVIRAQGNATGRGRMRPDGTLRRVKPPRGQLLSTGEEVPSGQSLRARMLTVEVRQGEVKWETLSLAQKSAAAGAHATAMAGFIQWLAPDLELARKTFQQKRMEYRAEINAEHKRIADVVAQLAAAWCLFLLFAFDIGAIDEREADRFEADVWAGLHEVAGEQADLQRAAEPVNRFRDLLIAALATGRAHIAAADTGRRPEVNPERWGWARDPKGFDWTARGECIGWLSPQGHLYLEPDVSYAVASRIGPISVSAETLSARLADAGVTVFDQQRMSNGGYRRRYRPKRPIKGVRQRVLHIRSKDWVSPSERGASGASGADTEKAGVSHEIDEVDPAPQ